MEEIEEVQLEDNPEHITRIGTSLSWELRDQLIMFLRINKDVFAWSPSNMPGISSDLIAHELNLNLKKKPMHQKISYHAPEKQVAIEEKVQKLLKARFIREEKFPTWLTNVVMARKVNGK